MGTRAVSIGNDDAHFENVCDDESGTFYVRMSWIYKLTTKRLLNEEWLTEMYISDLL